MRTSHGVGDGQAVPRTCTALAIALLAAGVLAAGARPGPGAPIVGPKAVGILSRPSTWMNVTPSSPARPPLDYWASMALDYPDRELILFGGCGPVHCPEAAQTWTFAHGAWTNVTGGSPQPAARSYATLDYDSADGVVLLFGGVGTSSVYGDTWTFSGGNWTDLTASLATRPAARWGASMAYDPVDRGVLLFGGMSASGVFLNDTWIFASGVWRELAPSASPPARFEASMAWDAAASEAVLVNGCGANACPLGDAWRYQNGSWSPLPSAAGGSPPARNLAVLSYDAADRALLLFSGIRNDTSLGDAWTYASGSWTASNASAVPSAREGAAILESTEVWTPQGSPVVWPYLALWGGDWVPCPSCHLAGLADTWVYEPVLTTIVASGSADPSVGTPVAFGASVSGGTQPYRYAWTYGDGVADAAGPDTTHAFAAVGSYTVSLAVVDDAGARSQVSTVVQVTAPASGLVLGAGLAAGGALVALGGWWVIRRRRAPPS